MLGKKTIPVLIGTVFLSSTLSYADTHKIGFMSGEHVAAGDDVKVFFSANDPGTRAYRFHLPNGVQLSYGEIVSMGDFYGVVGKPIAFGKTDEERTENFIGAFNNMATDPATVVEMPKILGIMHSEEAAVDAGMKRGEKPETIYAAIGGENDRLWNCVTGGGCTATWYLQPGRYLDLMKQSYDHFASDAMLAYETGHNAALKVAVAAHAKQDVKQLELAYAMNAFAQHFLSDRFAAGHIRVPRDELPATVSPAVIGSLLADLMHNEENMLGLHVHNARGDHWMAYGDAYYYDAINQTNRGILNETLQKSADEIFAAYQSGVLPAEDAVTNLIPQPDEVKNFGTQDVAPLFYWDAETQKVFRRKDVNSPYDREWTEYWLGWETLIELEKNKVLPAIQQAALVNAGYGSAAMRAGLITDKNIAKTIK